MCDDTTRRTLETALVNMAGLLAVAGDAVLQLEVLLASHAVDVLCGDRPDSG